MDEDFEEYSTVEEELQKFRGDKKMVPRAVKSVQVQMASEMNRWMAKDMDDVLSGKVKIDVPKRRKFTFKVKCALKKFFSKFEGNENNM